MGELSKPVTAPLEGLSALVTGAASGMGRATAILLARQGARVAVTDLDESATAPVVEAIVGSGGQAVGLALDVSSPEAIRACIPEVADKIGGLDIVVNNAGISRMAAIDDEGYDALWDTHIAILLTAHQRVIRAALPYLRESDNPRIVNIASTEGLGATAGLSAYSAAKAGVIGLTRSLAVELGREGITVNCICPGPIETAMTAGIPEADKAIYAARRTALRRYGTPEEVAHMTASLVAPAASYVTGAVIPVDGGLMVRNA